MSGAPVGGTGGFHWGGSERLLPPAPSQQLLWAMPKRCRAASAALCNAPATLMSQTAQGRRTTARLTEPEVIF